MDGDDAIADAERFGMDEASIAAITASLAGPHGGGVWPQNAPAVAAFLTVATQWRTAALPSGRVLFIGLDYSGAKVALDAAGIAITPAVWSSLAVMEIEAIDALNQE